MKKSSHLDKLIHLTSIHSKLRSAIFSMRQKNSGPYFTVRTSNSVNKKYLNDECIANCQVHESCYCKFRCVFLDRERGRVKQYPFILGLPSRRPQQLKWKGRGTYSHTKKMKRFKCLGNHTFHSQVSCKITLTSICLEFTQLIIFLTGVYIILHAIWTCKVFPEI